MAHRDLTRRGVLAIGCGSLFPQVARTQQLTRTQQVPDAWRVAQPFVRGVSSKEKEAIAQLGETFLRKFDLPGISLAMSYKGKLKLLACFGYANRERLEPVRPTHQFRIASVSKPITSVAILRLVELGRLTLDHQVFDEGGHLARFTNAVSNDSQRDRIRRISVRHLLDHSLGGWSNKRGDAPMFAKEALGMPHDELIRWTLQNRPLKNEPGTNYAYSNFGYCLLGRVVESVTNMSYQLAVKQLVLDRVGASATAIGGHKRHQRQPREVVYYDEHDPYGRNMDVTRMDAHGGWISTPTDLVRFANHVDGFDSPHDILEPKTLSTMTTAQRGHYALGWSVNARNNWWHTGSFNGGSSILARIRDGHCWAVVVNTRPRQQDYKSALDNFPWDIKTAVGTWGGHNLFAR